jgi:GNAT superfamily N-acetyltransferase
MTVVCKDSSISKLHNLSYRQSNLCDAPLILSFIRKLAAYEKLLHECVATEDDIRESLFGENPKAFCVIAEEDNKPVGFALCFYNYSTFQGKAGLYIEDLFVEEEYRGYGIGKGFFQYLAQKAKDENLGRIQWWVLDWNEPSINFYKKMGAVLMDEWTVCRLEGAAINALAETKQPMKKAG